MSEDDKLPYMHDVTLREAQTIFFDHVNVVIFRAVEALRCMLCTLCSLLFVYLRKSYSFDLNASYFSLGKLAELPAHYLYTLG